MPSSRAQIASNSPSQVRASAEIVPFPLAYRRSLVVEMADRFLTIPPGPRRVPRFNRVLGWLTKDLRKLGISAERAELELEPFRCAVAVEVRRILVDEDEGGAA